MSDPSDVGAPYERADGKLSMRVVLYGLAQTLGLYTPARDVYLDWFFGSDFAYSASLTVAVANDGLWLDMREINPAARSIVIEVNNAAVDYDYEVYFSRDGTNNTRYLVASNLTNTTAFVQVNLPSSIGYDQYVQLVITPDVLEPDDGSRNFKAYLTGKGG